MGRASWNHRINERTLPGTSAASTSQPNTRQAGRCPSRPLRFAKPPREPPSLHFQGSPLESALLSEILIRSYRNQNTDVCQWKSDGRTPSARSPAGAKRNAGSGTRPAPVSLRYIRATARKDVDGQDKPGRAVVETVAVTESPLPPCWLTHTCSSYGTRRCRCYDAGRSLQADRGSRGKWTR